MTVDAGMDHADFRGGHAARNQIVPGTLADRMEAGPAVGTGKRPLAEPDRGGHGPWRLLERRLAEEMGHQHTERQLGHRSEEEGELVDVLDYDVGPLCGDRSAHRSSSQQRETVPPAVSLDLDSSDRRHGRRAGPPRADQSHPVPGLSEPAEDLEEVDLGPTGMGVLQILPVDRQNVHRMSP